MADVQQTYKFSFEFNRKDIKKQLKEISLDVKDAISQIGDASDKVVIFKELVSYLSNVDKALDAFKTKHKDDFSNIFGSPDKEILGVLTEIFNTTQQSAQAFATLKDKIASAESGKAELSTLRGIAEEINALFVSIGQTPKINIDEMFSGKGSKAKGTDFAGRIKLLNDTIAEFGITYSGFQNKLKGGFSFGGTGGSSISKEMQKEIDALNKQKTELQEIIDAIEGKDIKINISVKDDAKQIKNLLEEYKKINSKTISNEFKNLSLNDQNKLLAEQLRLATLLKNARDHINKKGGSDEAFDLVNTGEGMHIIDNIEKSLDGYRLEMQKKADQIKKIYDDLIANIDVKLNQISIDNLNMEPTRQSITSAIELMQEANRIIGEISYDSQNYDLLDAQLDSIIDKIKQLAVSEEQVEQLDELLEANRDAPEDVLDELCTILEVDIPRAAEKARDAIDSIAGGQNGPSKQNISILAKQLQEIYNISRQIGDNEIGFAVDIDGSAYFVQSADHIVKVADEASVAVRALNENLTILGHTHPSGGGLFSAGDYRSAISQKRSGMNMPVVAVGSNAASLLNLDGVNEEVLSQIEHVIDRFKNSDDAVGPSVIKELQNILSTNGFTDALQVVDISNGMDDLSEALLKLSLNAKEVQTPLQKLQSLIQYYSSNQLGADNISRFADEWKAFESGAKSAAEVFDSVMYKLDAKDLEGNYFRTSEKEYENLSTSLNMIKPSADTATNAISGTENKLKSFLEFADKMQHENLYGSAENNVDIGRYIERLETEKKALEELGAQGLITAKDLEKVNQAYSEAITHLEAETSHYDSYYSGPSYDYYDDYKQEQSKNGDLENELTRKDERIAELESDLRSSDDALQETLGNKYALIAESRTLEIERAKLLLQKQNLEYEDILALMQSYQNLQAKAKEAFDYGDEKAMHDMQDLAGQIYDKVVPQNLDDFTEPDRWFKAVGVSAEEGAQNLLEFRERLDAVHNARDDLELSDAEDIGDLQRENGALQDKLDLLNEIASVCGSNITQKDRKRYEELTDKEMESGLNAKEEDRLSDLSDKVYDADSALEELGNTYDKIILKLANGKKVEILPDDAGLRALHKFADEGYGETYGGVDVEDVVFVRKQEQSVIEQTNQELQERLNLQKQINDESKKDAQIDNIDKEPAVEAVSKDTIDSQEVTQLEALQQKLLEVKSAVDAKTQAFEAEFVTVNNVVDSEIMALQSLIGQLQEVAAQINLINDGFNNLNTNAPKIELKSAPVEQSSVTTENTHYVTDPQGRPVNAYRGIEGAYSGLVSNRYHGGTFWTTNIELAKEYAGAIGKVEKSLLSMKNPMEIDGHGAYWSQIEYIGDNSDEASKKLHELNSTIKQTESMLEHLKTIKPTEQELKNLERGFISETQNEREIREYTAALEKAKAERGAIFADSSNPYGKKNTNELVEIAKSKGYDGVIFKDIIDSATGDVTDLSTVMVTFEQDQIHYIETISSTFESAIASLKGQFGDLTQHISASSDEVEASIRKMAELKGKVKSGEISEDEYDAFISQNAIARDYDQLAKKARAVPDFITGALDGDEFDLKHVIKMINDMLDNMRNRVQKIATAFGKEGIPLDQLFTDNVNATPVIESSTDNANISGEIEQLDKLQIVLDEVKNAIVAKTKAFVDEGNVVGQTVGKEVSALMKLSETVDSIVPKVNALVNGLKGLKDQGVDIKDQSASNTGSDGGQTTGGIKDAPPQDSFKKSLYDQKNAFNEYRTSLKDVDYLTDSLRTELDALGVSLRQVSDQPGLDAWVNSFNVLKGSVKDVQSEFEQMNNGKINLYRKELNNSFNKLTLPQKEDLFNDYSKATILLKKQEQAVKDGHAVELAGIKQITAALQEQIDAQIKANKAAKDAEKTQKKNANFGSTASINATAKYNSLSKIAGSEQFASSSVIANALSAYEESYKRMLNRRDELRNSDVIDDSDREAFKAATTECNNYAKALDKIIQNSLKLKGNKANSDDYMLGSDFDYSDVDSRKAALADFAKQMYGVDVAATDFKDNWNKVVFAVDNGDGTFTQMTATFTDARNEIVAMAGDTKKAQGAFANFFDELKGKFKSIGAYLVASFSFHEIWSVIRQGINYVREIDSALTELKKVTDETDASYAQFLQDMSKTGSVIGATVADLTTMASEWARLGYSMKDAATLAESTAILLNVSEFDDATEASEALISTMQAFQYTADESQHVVDILNEVGNNFAVSSDGIATALQDSASALMEAGNNLEQSVALVAAANKVVQDPNSVGSALRTISLRLRGTSVEILEEMGEETDGVVESVSKMQEKIKALTGVDILTDSGAYKETYQILYEIGQVWNDLENLDRSALLELMAGKNRANTLAAILGNMKDLEGAYESALNAEGSALKENEAYLDSIQGRIDLFTNAVQTMWMNLLDTSAIKGIVDLGTSLIKFLDSSAGRITALGVALAALGKFLKIGPAFGVVNNQFQILGKTTETIKNNFAQLSEQSTGLFSKIGAGFKSVFGSSDVGINLSGMLSEGDFNEKLNTLISGFNNIDKSVTNIKWEDYVNGLSNVDDATKTALKTCTEQNGQIIAGANAYQTYTGATASAAIGNQVVESSAKKSTIALIAQKAAALAANAALTMGLSLLISLAIKGVTAWANAEKEAAEVARSAVDASKEIKEQSESLNEYKEQIRELRTELDSNTLSESEAYDAREKLLTIQDELINKFGLEKTGINLVTGAIDEQIAAIDRLSKAEATEWLQNKQKSINNALNFFESDTQGSELDSWWEVNGMGGGNGIISWGATQNVVDMLQNYDDEHSNIEVNGSVAELDILFDGSVEEVKTAVEDFQDWLGVKETEMQSELSKLLKIDDPDKETQKRIDSLKADIEQLQDVREDIGVEHENWFGQDSIYATNKALIEELQYNTAIAEYDTQYGNILAAQNALKESQAKGDLDAQKSAINNIKSNVTSALEQATDNGQEYMVDYFNTFLDGLAEQEFEINVKANEDGLRDQLTGIIQESGEQGLSVLDNNQIKDLLDRYKSGEFNAGPDGTSVDYSIYTKEQVEGIATLQEQANAAGISVDALIDSLVNLGLIEGRPEDEAAKIVATVSSIDTLTSVVEKYKTVLETVNDISFDGQAISKDYYDTLKEQLSDVTVGAEEFSDAIEEQNGKYIVKNVALLKKLVAQSRKAKKATIEVARSQAQLQYRDIVDQMRNAVLVMGVEYDAYNLITDATFDNISAMREQIDTLKQTIQQYALLEVGLSDAASAYDEYEAAKERDAQLSYDESFLEMIKTIDEGLLNNETGSEAFEYSTRAVVPEEKWAGIKDPNEKVRAIHDYIDGDPVFSRLFHVDEESGELDINADNVREFIKLSKEAGMIVGGPEGFELSDTVYGTKEWAEALGVTEAAVLALLSATEDCDTLWGNILTDVMTHPLDREINKSVDEVDDATKKLEDYLKLVKETNSDDDETNDVEFDSEYYSQLVSDIGAANKKLEDNRQAAMDNAQAYNTVQAAISSFRGDLALTDGEATNLVSSLKEIEGLENLGEVVIEDGQLKLTDEQLTLILGKLGKIKEPSVVQIQLRYDEITNEIDQINEYIKEGSTGSITIDGIVFTNGADEDGNAIEDYLAKLTAEQKEIQLTYNITETSTEEQKSVLESYQEMAKNGVEFTVTAIVDDAKAGLDSVSDAQSKIKEKQTITFSTNASTIEQAIKNFADEYDRITSKVITLTVNVEKNETVTSADPTPSLYPSRGLKSKQKIFEAFGNARANGNKGLRTAEHDAVVGELGPELVCDPIKGIYYTVGNDGTEMVNLPKGAIIYNHKQTEELLKNGHTTRGKYTGGLSFAQGNAHSVDYGIPSYHPNLKDETSFDNGPAINTTWDDAASTLEDTANSISDAAGDISDAADEFRETFDWIEVRLEEINERLSLKGAQLENAVGASSQNAIIDEMISINEELCDNLLAGASEYYSYAKTLLAKVPVEYRTAAEDGKIAIEEFVGEVDEETLNAIQEYRDWVQKGADTTQQAEEVLTEIQSLAKQAFDNIVNDFENDLSLNDSKIGRYEAHNDLLETDKGWASEDIYAKMQKENETKIEVLKQQRDAMQAELDTGKIKKGTDAWYEAVNAIAEVDTEIVNLNTEIENLQDSINDLNWEQFEFLITQFQAVSDEAENLLDILATKDAVDEFGNWTNDGITSLGLLAQQMEVAEKQASKYEAAIEYLNENWETLGYTQTEYVDRLEELKSGQYDAIKSYNDAKESIRDLNETRVDAIKTIIEDEISAYEELIKTKKEALDAEKDLYDFQKGVSDQQKEISDIERKLAALAYDNSSSAMAQKAKLQAELAEKQQALEETYYDRSVNNQQDALDKELESFQEQKEEEIEGWEKYLENLEVVVADSLAVVQENTSAVLATLTAMQDQYGLAITNSLLAPWKAGETAIQEYGSKLNVSLTALAAMFGLTVDEFAAKLGLTTEQLVSNLDITVAQMAENLGLTNEQLAAKLGLTVTDLNSKMNMTIQQLAASMGITLPALAEKLGTTTAGLAGNLDMTMTQFASKMGLTVEGLAGKFGLTTSDLAQKLGMTYQEMMNPFGLSMSATVDALTALEKKYKSILDSIDADSRATVAEVNKAMDRYQEAQKQQEQSNNTSNNTNSAASHVNTEKDYYGVALAIWNGNYGWGNGKTRVANLTAKGFDANKVQQIVDQMSRDGYIRSGAWSGRYYGIKDLEQYHLNRFAKGTNSASKDQWALIDELGEELQLVPGKNGRLEYIKKGTGIVPADLTRKLMDIAMDPQDMLDKNRPSIGAPHIVNNEININMDIAEVVHIDRVDHDTLPDLTKAVKKEMDSYMLKVNNAIRSKVR